MRILDVLTSPWAIQQSKYDEIVQIYSTHLRGEKIDIKAVEARIGQPLDNTRHGKFDVIDGVAVIPISGVTAPKMNLMMQISGGTSTEIAADMVQAAVDDDEVKSMIIHIDRSPGGTVDGTVQLANAIRAARKKKPMVTLASGLMASAAVWVGTATGQVFIADSTTQVGSIGVVAAVIDRSEQLKKQGIKVNEIFAGKFKRMVSEFKPLSDEGRESIQAQVDFLYTLFVTDVARNLGVDVGEVIENMADARMFIGQQAIDSGLVNGFATLSELLGRMAADAETGDNSVFTSAHESKMAKLLKLPEDAEMKPTDITKAYMQENAPDVAAEFYDDGHKEGVASVDVAAITKAANLAERTRISGVLDQDLPGHEAMLKALAFDGKTTPEQAAVAVLQAEKSVAKNRVAHISADARELDGLADAAPAPAPTSKPKTHREIWDADADLREEFHGEFETYEAYEKAVAAGRVKILGGK